METWHFSPPPALTSASDPGAPGGSGLMSAARRRWWWPGANWLLIGPHWQISHLHRAWHRLGANNVFVRRGRRMSGILSARGISQARDNNGLVAANDVSKAIKVFLMFGQRWLWRDKQHETGERGDTHNPRQQRKKENSTHILPLPPNAVSRLYKYFEKFFCKCWHFKVCNNFDGMQTAVGKTKIWWLQQKKPKRWQTFGIFEYGQDRILSKWMLSGGEAFLKSQTSKLGGFTLGLNLKYFVN